MISHTIIINQENSLAIYIMERILLISVFVFIILTFVNGFIFYQFTYGYIETVLGEKIGIDAEGQKILLTDDEYNDHVETCLQMKQSGYLENDNDNDTNTVNIDCNTFVLEKEGFKKVIEYLRSGFSN